MRISKTIDKIKTTISEKDLEEDKMFISHGNIPDGFSLEKENENIKTLLTDYILKPLVKRNEDFHAHRFVNKAHKSILEIKYLTMQGDLIIHVCTGSALRFDKSFNDIEVDIIFGSKTLSSYMFSGKDNLLNNQYGILGAIESICKAYETLFKFNKHKFISEVDK